MENIPRVYFEAGLNFEMFIVFHVLQNIPQKNFFLSKAEFNYFTFVTVKIIPGIGLHSEVYEQTDTSKYSRRLFFLQIFEFLSHVKYFPRYYWKLCIISGFIILGQENNY
jgi:hypothetical protein